MRLGVALLTYNAGRRATDALNALSASTRLPDLICAVDNASDDDTVDVVRALAPTAHVIRRPSNDGYGAAMNDAVAWLTARGADLVVCLTHDCVVDPNCLAVLEQYVATEARIGAVGPLLVRRSDPQRVWSAGGRLDGWRRAPRHIGQGEPVARWRARPPRRAEWLDGALIAVRTEAFQEVGGFRDDLFLYWEDVDLCLRLRRAGWGVEVVPGAVAQQEPSFTPPYLATRNKLRVAGANLGGLAAGAATVESLAQAARDVVQGARTASGASVGRMRLAGMLDAATGRLDRTAALDRPPPSGDAARLGPVVIVNPLPAALAHYVRELRAVLDATATDHELIACPSAEVGGSAWNRLRAARQLWASYRSSGRRRATIVAWPAFGFLEPVMWPRRASPHIVFHDPEPLRRQRGMGRTSLVLGRRRPAADRVIVHTGLAAEALTSTGWPAPAQLPHPLLKPAAPPSERGPRSGIAVVGQWKPARSLAPLHALAADGRWRGRLRVVGRGWPPVAGWAVDSRFVSEPELDAAIATAQCIVLPYDRYFQSNVAVRALESLTPVVGLPHPFLFQLLGDDWPGIVVEDDWCSAVERALAVTPEELHRRYVRAWESCLSRWRAWARALPSDDACIASGEPA